MIKLINAAYRQNQALLKATGFFVLVLAAIPLVMLLSGAIVLLSFKYNPITYGANVCFWAWPDYFSAWQQGQLVGGGKRIALAAIASLAIIYLIVPMLIVLALREKRELHGSARWASASEVGQAGLFGNTGIVVGKYRGKTLRFPGQQFVILAAPTRSGKGVGVVIPNLLSYEESVCVLDIKQENFDITAGYRQNVLKQAVYLFNPFAEDIDVHGQPAPRTHRYNFLSAISKGAFRVGDVITISNAIWSSGGKDVFWNDNARNLFLAVTLCLCELRDQREDEGDDSALPDYPVTMGEVLRQTSGRDSGLPIKKYFTERIMPYKWLSSECRGAFTTFLNASDNVLSDILSTFNAPLLPWRNPIVDAATSACDFDVRDVRRKKMSIYIGITPNKLDDAKLIINLLFSQLVNLNTKELPQKNPAVLKYQCLLLMDEFTSMGVINVIAKSVGHIAGYNLRLLPIIQSTAQLESATNYGKDDARTLITNHAMQIVYAPRDQKDANEVSESLGYFTEKSTSLSRPRGFSKNGGSGSENTSDQRRALLLPQEVKEIGQWKEIIFLENVKPILCDKIRYFDDPEFTSRVIKAPAIRPINIALFIAKMGNRLRALDDSEMDLDAYALKPPVTAEYLDIYDKTEKPPTKDPLDEQEVQDHVYAALVNMGVTREQLSMLDTLDQANYLANDDGLDTETAQTRMEAAFAGLETETSA
ncbi:type IV secretory system conjugative DNA transfer family protein [Methylotenera sp.]|jgi:type IV secretion system protein VirD4|uniref:type IV secretory system conjugative DNA transfer family protein n=1 Tax=Methylotenera sp. TaxID=2051956 RepID=UPI002727B4BB|nr:type IV secretory system conjugative DNA transfer family protein [Methylotenera sp.]MDO9204381.1 type IV secretory system conjugative DNA transfer family protein [Methylotenera sp.]MDP1523353.1 type IV secretory system conjugative DNA transfer family protein [Methylotenera sp.]MDP1658340.1 type IV secretory system conjugative DNA transfer family protein [Methylotenera sp.]MDP3308860.1 type IV secretory system conjugative DNA transfer family protein [Methylotenera sp.]MDP3819496.1 type IV se